MRDPTGQAIDVITSRKERPGRNVVLTLDHQLQANAEQILARAVSRWRAKGATAIVMDPRSGAILAMANAPTFDANAFTTAPADARRNRAVTDLYEPGSTFKIVTIAAALEDNVVAPDTSFWLQPTIDVADRVIREAHIRGTERMTVRQILSESSNVGTITIAEKLGGSELASWIDRFGFGSKTGVGAARREPRHRASARTLVGLDDRHRADRAGHRRDAAPDGERVRGDRERRRDARRRTSSRRSAARRFGTGRAGESSRGTRPTG